MDAKVANEENAFTVAFDRDGAGRCWQVLQHANSTGHRIGVVLPNELSLSIIAHSCDQQTLLAEAEDGVGDVSPYATE